MNKTHYGIGWNKKGERTIEWPIPFIRDGRLYGGFSLFFFTVGWWRKFDGK